MAGYDIKRLRDELLANMGGGPANTQPYMNVPPNQFEQEQIGIPQYPIPQPMPQQMTQQPSVGQPTFSAETEPTGINLIEQYRSMFKPETAATERFAELMSQRPERENPSLARRLVASGVAIRGGVKGAEEVLSAPHLRATEDWKAQVDPAYQAANLERYANANDRQVFGSVLNAANDRASVNERERSARAREDLALEKQKLERMKVEGWSFDFDGPEVMAYHKNLKGPNGEYILERTGVKTNSLSQADLIILRSQLATNQAMLMENERRVTNQMPTPDENLSENQANTRRQTALRSILEERAQANPWVREWIKERNGVYNLEDAPIPSDSVFSRVTPEKVRQYQQIIQWLNPDRSGTPSSGATVTTEITGARPQSRSTPSQSVPVPGGMYGNTPNQSVPVTGGMYGGNQAQLRDEAVAYLTRIGKATSEENIRFYIDRMSR